MFCAQSKKVERPPFVLVLSCANKIKAKEREEEKRKKEKKETDKKQRSHLCFNLDHGCGLLNKKKEKSCTRSPSTSSRGADLLF